MYNNDWWSANYTNNNDCGVQYLGEFQLILELLIFKDVWSMNKRVKGR